MLTLLKSDLSVSVLERQTMVEVKKMYMISPCQLRMMVLQVIVWSLEGGLLS